MWSARGGKGYWLRAQPADGKAPGPTMASPGAKLFKTQPDGLWVHFGGIEHIEYCDVAVIEVCGTVQNLNEKRSRYSPASHSLVLRCSVKWFAEEIAVQRGGRRQRWAAAGSIPRKPAGDDAISIPIRHLRVLYALCNSLYDIWVPSHTPTGYEYFCTHASLDGYSAPKMQTFLRQMSVDSQFYTRP